MKYVSKSEINYRNVIDVIDESVLGLKNVKKNNQFSDDLFFKLTAVLQLLKKINDENYESSSFDKSLYIEKDVLDGFRKNFKEVNIDEERIDHILGKINKLKQEIREEEVIDLQRQLIQISLPIWNVQLKMGEDD